MRISYIAGETVEISAKEKAKLYKAIGYVEDASIPDLPREVEHVGVYNVAVVVQAFVCSILTTKLLLNFESCLLAYLIKPRGGVELIVVVLPVYTPPISIVGKLYMLH